MGTRVAEGRQTDPVSAGKKVSRLVKTALCSDWTGLTTGSNNLCVAVLFLESGDPMHAYEIRILSQRHTQMVIAEIYLSDYAAIRAGQKFAAGRAFEVWRGADCIYDNPNMPTYADSPSQGSGLAAHGK
jgi:hypothetical protein